MQFSEAEKSYYTQTIASKDFHSRRNQIICLEETLNTTLLDFVSRAREKHYTPELEQACFESFKRVRGLIVQYFESTQLFLFSFSLTEEIMIPVFQRSQFQRPMVDWMIKKREQRVTEYLNLINELTNCITIQNDGTLYADTKELMRLWDKLTSLFSHIKLI